MAEVEIDWASIVVDVVEHHSGLKTEQIINICLKRATGNAAHMRGPVRRAMHNLADQGVLNRRRVFAAYQWFKA
jgi:hypothetical protein